MGLRVETFTEPPSSGCVYLIPQQGENTVICVFGILSDSPSLEHTTFCGELLNDIPHQDTLSGVRVTSSVCVGVSRITSSI